MLALAGLVSLYIGCSGSSTTSGNRDKKPNAGADVITFEETEIILEPGETKELTAKKGKPESAEVPKDSELKADVKDGKVTFSVDENAKEGKHEVTVKAGSAKAALKVTIAEAIALKDKEITLAPGAKKEVEVKKGKPTSAEVPEKSGLKAEVKDGKLTVSADDKAKEGSHDVNIKGAAGKAATLKVTVKKKS
jgi:uncharacterized cupredoxin-like copper-binding protein